MDERLLSEEVAKTECVKESLMFSEGMWLLLSSRNGPSRVWEQFPDRLSTGKFGGGTTVISPFGPL